MTDLHRRGIHITGKRTQRTQGNGRVVGLLILAISLSGCANSALGKRVEQSLRIPTPIPSVQETPRPSPTSNNVLNNTPNLSPNSSPNSSPGNRPESQNPQSLNPQSLNSQSLNPNASLNPSPNPSTSGSPSSSSPSSPPLSAQPSSLVQSSSGVIDKSGIPPSFRPSIEAVLNLGVIQVPSSPATVWEQPVSRRTFARWLFTLNNRLYSDRPGQQIRPSSTTAKPIFQDIPATDPDFVILQGLAEAGILPSPLRGNPTVTQFRPDAPLTREQMVLWKVPLDAHQSLPTATLDRIAQTWNFQDASQISGETLGAVLLDFQNGDLSNIRRVFGYTTLLQPRKPVTQAEAIQALSYFGFQGQGVTAQTAPSPSPSP